MKSVINLNLAFWALLLVFAVGCKKDPIEPTPTTTDPIASFQYEVSTTDFLSVSFSNFSKNATSYSWDFGDSNTSTEESPTHTYAAAGNYTVTLTATGADSKTATKSESISITDPNAQATLLAGTGSKEWFLQREGEALGIGPNPGDNSWWSFGGVTPLGDRPCILDDVFTFHSNGKWEFNSNGTIWVDAKGTGGWFADGVAESCYDESDAGVFTSENGDDLSAFANGGDYTYEYDAAANTLVINGLGAYIGLANKGATGDDYIPKATRLYEINNLVDGSVADSLQISIPINGGADGYWNFNLVSYDNPADAPDIPAAKPTANFSFAKEDDFTVKFTNSSLNATSYTWDFGDGGMSMDENPTHTYAAEGDYTVTLTASDDMSQSDAKTETISISAAKFEASVLSSAAGKIWKLDGEASYKVGPQPNTGDWWGGIDAAGVTERACQLDDEFIFTDGGAMEYDTKGDTWGEAYMGVDPPACVADVALTAPWDVLGSGNHTFSVVEAAGMDPAQITVTGSGAFIGFNKPVNGGELGDANNPGPVGSVTYDVFEYSKTGNTERLILVIKFTDSSDPNGYWTMSMISEN